MRLIREIGNWLDERLQLGAPIRETMQHPIPRDTASWFYVFGSAAMTVFGLQFVTGILLALIYVPSAGEAWNSLQILNHQVSLGWFIRALHGWDRILCWPLCWFTWSRCFFSELTNFQGN